MRRLPPAARVLALGAVAVLLAACAGDDGGAAAPTTSTTATTTPPPPTTDVPTIDVAVVPEEIDAVYLEAVMAVLDDELQAAFTRARAAGDLGAGFEADLRALYDGEEADALLAAVRRVGLDALADPPGPPTTTVEEVVTARADCVFLTADRDLTPLSAEPYEQVQPYYLQLVPSGGREGNPTAWAIARDVFFADGTRPGDPCA